MEERHHYGGLARRVSAGLQAGTLAGLAMLAWIMTGAWVQGQSFWTIPNLLAYTFHGARMYRPDFVSRTWSGLAFHFLFAAILGVVFALVLPRALHSGSAAIFGAIFSLALYAVAGVWLWDQINPPMNVYARQPFVLAGYVLYGVLLGSVPLFSGPAPGAPSRPPLPLVARPEDPPA
jgi:hypothetical protein